MQEVNRADVVTSEAVAFSLETAGIGNRFIAALLDFLLQSMLFGALALAGGLMDLLSGPVLAQLGRWGAAAIILLLFLIFWAYHPLFEIAWSGQTPGKRWMNLRVVGENGQPVTAMQSVLRNIVRIADFLPILYGVGLIAVLIHKRGKRLGDLVAGTIVVKEREFRLPETSFGARLFQLTPDQEASVTTVAGRLRRDQLELIRRFLARRNELSAARRTEMAARLFHALFLPTIASPEMYEPVLEELERRAGG